MSFLSGYFGALVLCFSIFIFTHVSSGFDNNVAHDLELEPRDDLLPQQGLFVMQQDENRNIGSMPLDGRSLIDSWLGRRQACAIAGDSPCPTGNKCCRTGDTCCSLVCCQPGKECCPSSLHCAEKGGKCCGTRGVCPSGWNCCGLNNCSPDGGECCTTGNYCPKGNHCYMFRGNHVCCTDSKCTAYVADGVTSTRGGGGNVGSGTVVLSSPTIVEIQSVQVTPTSISITRTSLPPSETIIYRDYFYTFTWYYWSWYWTYSVTTTRTLTISTYITVTTSSIYTIKEANPSRARESYSVLTAGFSTPTPSAAVLAPTPPSTIFPSPSLGSSVITASAVSTAVSDPGNIKSTVFVTSIPSAGSTLSGSVISSSGSGQSASSGASRNFGGMSWMARSLLVVSMAFGGLVVYL